VKENTGRKEKHMRSVGGRKKKKEKKERKRERVIIAIRGRKSYGYYERKGERARIWLRQTYTIFYKK